MSKKFLLWSCVDIVRLISYGENEKKEETKWVLFEFDLIYTYSQVRDSGWTQKPQQLDCHVHQNGERDFVIIFLFYLLARSLAWYILCNDSAKLNKKSYLTFFSGWLCKCHYQLQVRQASKQAKRGICKFACLSLDLTFPFLIFFSFHSLGTFNSS